VFLSLIKYIRAFVSGRLSLVDHKDYYQQLSGMQEGLAASIPVYLLFLIFSAINLTRFIKKICVIFFYLQINLLKKLDSKIFLMILIIYNKN
jgi:hypothetical protein